MSYFACWSSRPAVVRIFRILSQLLPMDQQQVLPPLLSLGCQKNNFSSTWLLRSSQSWFLWFDLLQLGTRTVLITQNQHMNCSMNPLHDRTRIGWVEWIGPSKIFPWYIRTVGTFTLHYIRYLALSYTSSLSPLQNPSGFPSFWCAGHLQVVAPKRRFTLTRFVCCQPHVSEVAKTQPLREAEFLKPARYISQNINLKHEGHMDQAYGSFWTKHIDQIYERSVVSIVSLAKQAMPELASCADVPRWKKGRSPDMSLEILDW